MKQRKIIGDGKTMLNRKDFLFMKILYKEKCTSYFISMTMREVAAEVGTSKSTVYRSFLKLLEKELIKKGCLSEKAETYYLTEKGIKTIENGGYEEC